MNERDALIARLGVANRLLRRAGSLSAHAHFLRCDDHRCTYDEDAFTRDLRELDDGLAPFFAGASEEEWNPA